MSPCQHKELWTYSELPERDLRQHRRFPSSHISLLQIGLTGEDLDKASIGEADGLCEEGTIKKAEGMEGDAVLGQQGEVEVQGVVSEGGSKKPPLSCNECGGGTFSVYGRDGSVGEDSTRGYEWGGGVGVDVDVVEMGVALEEELP